MTRARPRTLLVLIGIAVCQFALLSVSFPLAELLTDNPLFYIDNAAHWYRVTVADNLFRVGNITGYDPFFNAGTMAGIAANPAAKVPAAMAILLQSHFNEIQIWKLYVFAASMVAAVSLPFALSLLRAPSDTIVYGSIGGLLLWWVSESF